MTPVAVVAGALANKPHNGGEAWVRLSWVLGLRRLGFDVWFVEQVDREMFGRRETVDYFDRVCRDFGLDGRSVLISGEGERAPRRDRRRAPRGGVARATSS